MGTFFSVPDVLFGKVQIALKMTQRELGEFIGVDRRTIQRYQSHGGSMNAEGLLKLAGALDEVDAALAAQCRSIASQDPTVPASDEILDAVMGAAARATGMSAEAVQPGVEAAFREAARRGMSLHAVMLGITNRAATAKTET
jgi:transcriptional regulator with XRE-family HTH domain